MAAWVWLEREGLLLPAPGQNDRDWVFVSQRGRAPLSKEGFAEYRFSSLFPHKTLHPANRVQHLRFVSPGALVFEAFRAVEVALRAAGVFRPAMVGTDLMREAFATHSGPLTDPSAVVPEQEATSNLFAGAIGLFKNPTSHRAGTISKPADAVALVMLAGYRLRLVEERATARGNAGAAMP